LGNFVKKWQACQEGGCYTDSKSFKNAGRQPKINNKINQGGKMSTVRSYVFFVSLVLASLILAGCASSTPVPAVAACPTSEPLSCPTNALLACPTSVPLSCPTAAAQVAAIPNDWRIWYDDGANVVVTFDPGDKCSLDIKNPVEGPGFSYQIVVNDNAYQNYVVIALQLEDGKTLKDLEEYNKDNPGNPPEWSTMPVLEIVGPNSSTWHGITLTGTPVYFVCIVQGPSDQQVIDEFGPVQLANQ
jgi:hypothetical protein